MLQKRSGTDAAGVVDEDVETPEMVGRLVYQRTDLVGVQNVRRYRQGFTTHLTYPRCGLLTALGNDVADGHVRAHRRIGEGDRPADASTAAGDDGDLISQKDVRRIQALS